MLGKIQNAGINFGNLKVDSDYPTRSTLENLVNGQESVLEALVEAKEAMDKSSGDTRITLYGLTMPRRNPEYYCLIMRSRQLRNIPIVRIPADASNEERCAKIKALAEDIEKRFNTIAANKELHNRVFDKKV